MSDRTPICAAEHLTVGYGHRPILQEAALALHPGEILALVGPNGAGKSTLLRALSGQLAPMGGSVLLDGKSLTEYSGPERARRLSLMLPHAPHLELTTCFELVAAGRIPYTGRLGILSAEDKRLIAEALEFAGASAFAQRDVNCLSDGQRQRVLLARAICQQPKLLLLDEPTSFLDIAGKAELLEKLRLLAAQRHIAILLSLHELELAQRFAHRVACVAEGGIFCIGTPDEVLTAENVARIYNLHTGRYDPHSGGIELPAPTGTPEVFVLGGNGKGTPLYRRLQQQGIPFYTGILYENDLDYPVAKALAAEAVVQPAFCPIGDEAYRKALALLQRCSRVLAAPQSNAPLNEANCRLLAEAERIGKPIAYK